MRTETSAARRSRLQGQFSCAIGLICLAAILSVSAYFIIRPYVRDTFVEDFSKRSAAFSYKHIFHRELTPDVEHFRAFGHSALAVTEIGADFTANPDTIRGISTGMKSVPVADVASCWGNAYGDENHLAGYNVTPQPPLKGTWVAWSVESDHQLTYLFWNPQRREAWYYYWSQ